MVSLLWVGFALAAFYFWVRGWWFASLIAAFAGAVIGAGVVQTLYDTRQNTPHGGWTIFGAFVGLLVGCSPLWIRAWLRELQAQAARERGAAYESVGSRMLSALGAPPKAKD